MAELKAFDSHLFLRALLAFVALPGIVAFVVPVFIFPHDGFQLAGLILLVPGTLLLLCCVGEFYRAGKGTLAPWSPPRQLVTTGPYRYSRNPMYVGLILVLCGWALAFESPAHWIYALSAAVIVHFRVVLFEEHWAERTFAGEWSSYRARVPRWLFPPGTRKS